MDTKVGHTDRKPLFVTLALVVAVVSLSLVNFRFGSGSSDWEADAYTLDEAVAMAEAQDKKIYLLFSADWCSFCIKFKDGVLADPEVMQAMEQVVFLFIDYDKEPQLVREFEVAGLPAGFLLELEDGRHRIVKHHQGALTKNRFLNFLP